MLRWVIFSVVVVVGAGIATIAASYLSTSSSKPDEPVPTGQSLPAGPTGTANLTEPTTFKFGTMSQQSEGKHDWYLTNTGKGELKLSKGDSTCSCTMANLAEGQEQILAAGQSTKITLSWNTKTNNGPWSQRATILVKNDPDKQKIDFFVEGTVRPAITTFPTDGAVDYGSVENDVKHDRDVAIFSIDRPNTKFKIKAVSNANLLDVSVKPVTPDELKQIQAQVNMMHAHKEPAGTPPKEHEDAEKGHSHDDAQVKTASKVSITLKANAPLAGFAEEVLVETDHPAKPTVQLHVHGNVKGPITMTPERFRMLEVSAKKGDTQKVTIWVRDQKKTNFTVEKKPKNVEVKIAAVENSANSANSAATRYELTLTVPPGAAPGSITDDIVLKTDHPRAAEVKVPVVVLIRAN